MSRTTRALLTLFGVILLMLFLPRMLRRLFLPPDLVRISVEGLLYLLPSWGMVSGYHLKQKPNLFYSALMLPLGAAVQLAGVVAAMLMTRMLSLAPSGGIAVGNDMRYTIFALCILPAVAEELFFRAGVFSALLESWPMRVALPFSVTVFALMHGSLTALPALVLLGLILCAVWAKHQDMLACITLHFSYNLTAVVLSMVTIELTLPVIGAAIMFFAGGILLSILLLRTCYFKPNVEKWFCDRVLIILLPLLLVLQNLWMVL